MSRPARRARGHIEERSGGSYRVIVFAGLDPPTRRRRYLKKTVHSYGEAKRELTKLQNQVDERRHPRSKVTVGEVIDQWLEVAALEDSTRDRYDGMIRLYIRPHLGSLEVGKVDAELLEYRRGDAGESNEDGAEAPHRAE